MISAHTIKMTLHTRCFDLHHLGDSFDARRMLAEASLHSNGPVGRGGVAFDQQSMDCRSIARLCTAHNKGHSGAV